MTIYSSGNIEHGDFDNRHFSAYRYVVTSGGEDRIVMQWRVQMDPDDEAANVAGPSGEDSQLEEEGAAEDGLAEFVAVKPWLGTIVPPTNPPKPTKDAPEVSLELECVHGYRAQDARNNARFVCTHSVQFYFLLPAWQSVR